MNFKLWKHQQELIDLAPLKWLLAWETGVGKSLTAIRLCEKKKCFSVLVICPKSLKKKWEEDITKLSQGIMTWKVVSKEEFKKFAKDLSSFDGILVDESHYFANMKSQMSKSLLWHVKKHDPRCIYLLTATPFLSTPFNIFTQGVYLGQKWKYWEFKNKFFYDVPMNGRRVPMLKTKIDGVPIEDEIAKLVNTLGNTVKMADCIEVPEQTFLKETFYLTKEQKTAIEEVKETESNHIVKWTKCHCIANGILNGDGYTEDRYFKCDKTQRVIDLCLEHKKIAIVARYKLQLALYRQKLEKLGKRVFMIDGDNKNKHDDIKEINKIEKCVVLIQSQTSEGYSLETVPIMIFASYDFSLKNYIQIKGRLLRRDHIKKNVYISLVNNEGIDKDLYHTVVEKKQQFQLAIYNN